MRSLMGEYPFKYPRPENHELAGPRPNSRALTKYVGRAKEDDSKVITYEEYLQQTNATFAQLLEKRAKEIAEAVERKRDFQSYHSI